MNPSVAKWVGWGCAAEAFVVWCVLWYASAHHIEGTSLAAGDWALSYLCVAIVVLGSTSSILARLSSTPRSKADQPSTGEGAPIPGHPRSGRAGSLAPLAIGLVVAVAMVGAPTLAARWAPAPTTCVCGPWNLGIVYVSVSEPAAGLFEYRLGIYPVEGLTTEMVGFRLTNVSNGSIALAGIAPSTCLPPSGPTWTTFTPANCGRPTGLWYLALVEANDTVANVFNRPDTWTGPTVELLTTMDLYLITTANLTAPGAVLSAFGAMGGKVVTGSVWV